MVETTGVDVPSGDFPFSIVGRWSRAPINAKTGTRVWSIKIDELAVGETLEPVGIVVRGRVYVLPCSCSPAVDAKNDRSYACWIVECSERAIRMAHKTVDRRVRVC